MRAAMPLMSAGKPTARANGRAATSSSTAKPRAAVIIAHHHDALWLDPISAGQCRRSHRSDGQVRRATLNPRANIRSANAFFIGNCFRRRYTPNSFLLVCPGLGQRSIRNSEEGALMLTDSQLSRTDLRGGPCSHQASHAAPVNLSTGIHRHHQFDHRPLRRSILLDSRASRL